MSIDQGNGATFTFNTSSFTANIVDISQDGETRDDIDTSHLGTTSYKTFDPADLSDAGTYTLKIQFDPEELASVPRKAAKEVMDLEYAISNTANATKGKVSFTGYVNSVSGTIEVDTLLEMDIQIKIDGTPTFTDETT